MWLRGKTAAGTLLLKQMNKEKGEHEGHVPLPHDGHQMGLEGTLAGLRNLAKAAGIPCDIGDEVQVRTEKGEVIHATAVSKDVQGYEKSSYCVEHTIENDLLVLKMGDKVDLGAHFAASMQLTVMADGGATANHAHGHRFLGRVLSKVNGEEVSIPADVARIAGSATWVDCNKVRLTFKPLHDGVHDSSVRSHRGSGHAGHSSLSHSGRPPSPKGQVTPKAHASNRDIMKDVTPKGSIRKDVTPKGSIHKDTSPKPSSVRKDPSPKTSSVRKDPKKEASGGASVRKDPKEASASSNRDRSVRKEPVPKQASMHKKSSAGDVNAASPPGEWAKKASGSWGGDKRSGVDVVKGTPAPTTATM